MADERTEKQKVQEITDKLKEGLKELFESEKYKTYLSAMSKFHNYSFNNTLLIAMQKPEATFVAGYKACEKTLMYACQQQKRLLDGHMVRYVADHEMLGGVG